MKALLALAFFAAAAPAFADEDAICADRPTKATGVCTVPKGHWQVEIEAANYARSKEDEVTNTATTLANTTLKYGLSANLDIEASWAPYQRFETKDPSGKSSIDGVGDLYVRAKYQVTKPGAALGLALIPFAKAPTADKDLGNRKWEGGVVAPIGVALPDGFALSFAPELDILAEEDGRGHRLALVNLAGVQKSWGPFTLYGEVWDAEEFQSATDHPQRSADIAASYLVTPALQLDAGVNFGLNRNTPDEQVYFGISRAF